MKDLKKLIRDVPDFPKKGIIFKDITPLLKDPEGFNQAVDQMAERFAGKGISSVVSVESRGFIFGAAIACRLGAGFVPVRKKGKLPYNTDAVTYDLEYGQDTLEIHKDAIGKGEKVLIVDDVLATGGTLAAVIELIGKLGGNVAGISFLIELTFLKGREKIKGHPAHTLITY